MTATTTDRDTKRSDGKLKAIKLAAVKVPKGVLVCINTSGYATNGADTANYLFAGVSYEQLLQRILHLGVTRAPASA